MSVMETELIKALESQVYSYEMDYHGYYHPMRMFRTINKGFFEVVDKQGLSMNALNEKINATRMMGMVDLQILKDIQVLRDYEDLTVYAQPLQRTRSVLTNRAYLTWRGETCAMLDGVAMAVGRDTRKVIPTQTLVEQMGVQLPEPLPGSAPRLELPEDMTLKHEYPVRYWECDLNAHLNVARYVDYVCEAVGYWEGKRKRLHRIKIEFNKECFPGDLMGMYVKAVEGGVYAKGVKQQTGETAFKAYCVMTEADNE